MIQILRHFGWTWVGLLYSDDDYGINAAQSFHQDVQRFGGCVAFSEILPNDNNHKEIQHIVGVIQGSTAKVVVVFSTSSYLLPVVDEMRLKNVTGRQWIASEAWATSPVLLARQFKSVLAGTLGIAIRRGEIQGLGNFLLRLRPDKKSQNNMVRIFWENMFGCNFDTEGREGGKICSGQEDLSNTDTPYTDVSELRASYNVYKAVYALAHALHGLMKCEEGSGPFGGNSCADKTNLKPWQVRPTVIVKILSRHIEELNVEKQYMLCSILIQISDKHITTVLSINCTAGSLPTESELHHRFWGSCVI